MGGTFDRPAWLQNACMLTSPSLWLLPPPGPLCEVLKKLISTTLPKRIPDAVPDFQPHITISSGLSPTSQSDFQAFLSSFPIGSLRPHVQFKRLRYGTAFWTKITLELHKSDSLKQLAVICRPFVTPGVTEEQARDWVEKYTTPAESGEQGFIPHLSLVYWEPDIRDEKYDDVRVGVRSDVYDSGLKLEEGLMEEIAEMGGWVGGKLVIVDTTRDVSEWKDAILAEREL
ncbi:hypothetical protein H072_284 [Dactylellina haptotyla CBS 200.50]|uniref:2',3'-cyclic-nucleotide 3'-phosphodiesterase n=1 Tax=Dactylellina haptotyla (strain CBS 200.50) TaxID=1284197 RepID=S8CDE0_DACHA|nr:hypothetical protein H072_284 [Dactylellina haptotyla CBS 200.50]